MYKRQILDYNKSITNYINHSEKELIGTNLTDIFPNQEEFLNKINEQTAGKIELEVDINHKTLYLEVDILFLSLIHI